MKEDDFQCEVDVSNFDEYGPMVWLIRPCEWYKEEYKDCKCEHNCFLVIVNCELFISIYFV